MMNMGDGSYGNTAEMNELQAGGAMAQQQGPLPVDTSGLVPMGAESQHPDQPVTDGAAAGPGASDLPGAEEDLMRYGAWLPVLKDLASRPEASNATRQLVRQLEAAMIQ